MSSFSQRYGYVGPASDIKIREDAPRSLRVVALNGIQETLEPNAARTIVCKILRTRPNSANFAFYKIWPEIEILVYACPWFKVYDLIEAFYEALVPYKCDPYEEEVNKCCIEEGIGWQLVRGQVVARGDEAFQGTIHTATFELQKSHRPTAASHVQSALKALSERPEANTPGAVAHSTSAVECLLNDITGEEMTLGKYLDKYPGLFHPALKKGLNSLYGFASDAGARHGKERIKPTFAEAQFALTVCAGACTLLTATSSKQP